jgi:hypothetical protein
LNPLIAIPSPRTIPEIIQALDQIKDYDKLWLKFMPEYMAYTTMREKFLSEKYTHLIICPDDLLIDDPNKLQILLDDYNNCLDPHERDNTIISGYCNVDHGAYSYFANITIDPVSEFRKGRAYKWLTLEDMRFRKHVYDNYTDTNNSKKRYLINVRFAGFPLFVIPRKIVEQIPFRNDSPTGKFDTCGCCVDVMFCYDALQKGCQIYVDTRVELDHLKINDIYTAIDIRKSQLQNSHFFFDYADKKLMVNE